MVAASIIAGRFPDIGCTVWLRAASEFVVADDAFAFATPWEGRTGAVLTYGFAQAVWLSTLVSERAARWSGAFEHCGRSLYIARIAHCQRERVGGDP